MILQKLGDGCTSFSDDNDVLSLLARWQRQQQQQNKSAEATTRMSCGGDAKPATAANGRSTKMGGWKSRLFPASFPAPPGPLSSVVVEEEEQAWGDAICTLFRSCESYADKGVATIHHVRQEQSWDCGIACLQMAAAWLGLSNYSRDWMLGRASTESIWTVDLVFVLQNLRRDNFAYLFCSRTFGINESLQDVRYYAAAFAEDRVRVSRRFQHIKEQEWPTAHMSRLSIQSVVACIQRRNCIAIVLVDNHILRPNLSHRIDTYVGHYILIAGTSDDPHHLRQAADAAGNSTTSGQKHDYCLVVHNPGCDSTVSYYTCPHFECSWRANGTDEDILFLVKHDKIENPM